MRAARTQSTIIRTSRVALMAMTGALLLGLFSSSPAPAATTITVTTTVTAEVVDGACGLAEAIIAANTDAAYDSCPAGSGADTIVLPNGTYTLTAAAYSNPNTLGPDGLPPITGVLTVEGNGATITRLASAPDFRILESTSTADLTLRNLTITGGYLGNGDWAGAGILNCGVLELVGVTVADNYAGDDGGGLGDTNCDDFDNLDLTITDSSFLRNSAEEGGAMTANYDGQLVITGSTFDDNVARSRDPGAVYTRAATTITDSSFSRNRARQGGGAIEARHDITILRTSFTSNQALHDGGAIEVCCYGEPERLRIVDSTFTANISGGPGGAVSASLGVVDITGSTFTGNQASGDGGALFTWRDTFNVTNSTFTANTAVNGGAIANRSTPGSGNPSVFNLTNVTMSGNGATGSGGNIYNEATSIASDAYTVTNSIIASPLSGGNCSGLIVDGGNNIGFGDATCTGFGTGNPQLQPLGNNGGPTQTMALGAGSAALDKIPPASCPATDQRGATRPQNALCDIGAYEKVVSGITTQASPGGLVGTAVTDTATVTGSNPTGTVTFNLFSDSGCMTNVGSSPNRPLTGGVATSAAVTLNAPGTYYWTAAYSGDSLNPPANSPCGAPNESVVITFEAPSYTRIIEGDHLGPVTVTAGERVLIKPNARVVGPVTVQPGGALTVLNAKIARGLVADKPSFLSICGSEISAPSTGAQALSVSNAAVAISIGDPANSCAGNRVAGKVNLTANLATTFGANQVSHATTVNNGGSGATVIKANVFYGTLSCTGNTPAPVNAGQPNTGPGAKTGQCAGS